MNNAVKNFYIAGMLVLGLFGIGALISVCCGNKHQWFMLIVCTILFIHFLVEYINERKK